MRAVVGTLRLKSNGESKIAISKAALCYGFAIALRALFLVIRRCDFSRTPFVIASEPVGRAWQSTVCEARIMKDSMPFDCFASLAMTLESDNVAPSVIARGLASWQSNVFERATRLLAALAMTQ